MHDRISTNFYWPGIGADIRRYCQSCDICQRNIPKGRVTKVPLRETPIIDTPFERVAVDLIGPMKPTTDRGHRFKEFKEFISISLHKISLHTMLTAKQRKDIAGMPKGQKRPEWAIP